MLPCAIWLLCLAAATSQAQDSALGSDTRTFSTLTTNLPTSAITGSGITYISGTTQSSRVTSSSTDATNATATGSSSDTNSQITRTSNAESLLVIGGTATSAALNGTAGTASSTNSAAAPSNTIPCNGYPEFCNRRYSNITEVCAHNSAFVVKNNVASNQALSIQDQLNDGVRMLQGETHLVNGTIYNCHTSCELLNAGTWQSELETLVSWLQRNPYDVVTFLIVNSNFADGVTVADYVSAIQNSGIAQYLYEPEYVPQHRDQWPTLGQMILSGKRAVLFMDYNANQTTVPYVLDEFTHMWETPFSPVNQSFPCTQQRPPGLDNQTARDDFMYLANHNLNTAIDVSAFLGSAAGSDSELLIPNTAEINSTNGQANQFGQLEAARLNCTRDWDRPPNFLLVDYYNRGNPEAGSVFEVAARANGVQYNKKCCGTTAQSAASTVQSSAIALVAAIGFGALLW